ncbi:hypothetical protein LLG95_02120 [bacterium]|nr:hypothetical protein [bacterium]
MAPTVAALAVRAGLIAAACWWAGLSPGKYALLHDGWEYLRLARAIAHGGLAGLDPATLRLFPGYPASIAALGMGQAYVWPALAISVLCGVACAPLAARLGRDGRIAWWMAVATPSWLVYSSTVMSDSMALLLAIAVLLLLQRRRWVWAGLAAGLAFCVRPVGALLFVPIAIEALAEGGTKTLARALAAGLPWPILYLVGSRWMLGDAVRSVREYTAQDFAWPLQSMFSAGRNPHMGRFFIGYNFCVLAVTWLGAIGLWRRLRAGDASMRPFLTWHLAAALFYLFLPSSWAFQALDRFYLAVWPTTLIGIAPWLPRRGMLHAILIFGIGIISFMVAARWLVNLAAVFPFAERSF